MERYRIVLDVALYYITFTVVEWLPVFIDETACKIVTDSLNYCIRNKFLGVNAYVILPTPLHAILFDIKFNSDRLKHTLDDMRKFTGCRLVADSGMPRSLCRRSTWMYSRRTPERIGNTAFGSQPNTPLVF